MHKYLGCIVLLGSIMAALPAQKAVAGDQPYTVIIPGGNTSAYVYVPSLTSSDSTSTVLYNIKVPVSLGSNESLLKLCPTDNKVAPQVTLKALDNIIPVTTTDNQPVYIEITPSIVSSQPKNSYPNMTQIPDCRYPDMIQMPDSKVLLCNPDKCAP